MLNNLLNRAVDTFLILKDAGTVLASGAGQVGGSNKIIDLHNPGGTGAVLPQTQGMWNAAFFPMFGIVDVTVFGGTNPNATIILQGSSSPTFATDIINLGSLELAAGTGKTGNATVDAAVGRYLIFATNWQARQTRQYLRCFHVLSGTTPSINYTLRLAKFDFR